MKKIGFVTTPINSGHAVRGIGFYTKRLLPHLKSQSRTFDFDLIELTDNRQLENANLDLIHYPFFDLFAHTLPVFKSTKTVVTIHDVIPLEFPSHYPPGLRGSVNLALQKISLNSVDRVITDSLASVKNIRRYLDIPHEKIKLVYLAADQLFKKVSKPKNKYNLPKKFVLYVGDINFNKNIPNLIRACREAELPLVIVGKQAKDPDSLKIKLSLSHPKDLVRDVLGIPHPQLEHLKEVKELFEQNSVITLGFVTDEDLVDIYNLATVYCQPSLSEGFGLPVLEAMSCGTPVTCSQTSSLPELAGDQAEYFDPSSVHEISEAIKKSVGKKIEPPKNFSWEKCALETLQVYSEVI